MSHANFRPAVECLESRQVPAGLVTASVVQGSLFLTGDAAGNQVQIDSLPTGVLRVTGLAGTTVNGAPSQQFRGVFNDVVVRLKGGNDTLTLLSADLPRNLVYRTGGGNDGFTGNNNFIGGNLDYFDKLNDDSLLMTNFQIGRHLRLNLGSAPISHTVVMTNVRVMGKMVATSSGATPDIWLLTDHLVHGKTNVQTGGGDDALFINDSTFLGRFQLKTGGGTDTVNLDTNVAALGITTFASPVKIGTGAGDDTVTLGAGMLTARVIFRSNAVLNGGAGSNTLNDVNTIKEGSFQAENFG